MAVTFEDQSICTLCGKPLKSDEQVFSFPAFIPNQNDPLHQFNDASFHIECLNRNPLATRAMQLANQFFYKIRPENRVCLAGGNLIRNADDYIFIDLLTSGTHEELFQFNFTTLDKNNLRIWNDREKFIAIAEQFRDAGKWRDLGSFRYLDTLIDKLQTDS